MSGQKFNQTKWNALSVVFVAILSFLSFIAALLLLINRIASFLAGGA